MNQNRIEWIDLVRALAILTVLYIHASDGIFIISSDASTLYTLSERLFQFMSLFIGRIGVPFFLMITGYLLLDRTYDDERVKKFWSKNCKGLIIVTVIWSIIYALTTQSVAHLSTQVNMVEAGNLFFSHMWYMPMIIGMYLSMPFVSNALKNFSPRTIYQATIVFTCLAFLLPFVSLICEIQGLQNLNIQYCLGFSGGIYGIYIIAGWLVKKGIFKKYSKNTFRAIALISFIICVLFQFYTFVVGYDFNLWYEFPFILTGSLALFELCSRREKVRGFKGVEFLSKYSFAVFLIHNVFRLFLIPLIIFLPFSPVDQVVILWILLIIFSYAAAVIIYRIPRFGKFILYMR